MKIGPSRKIGPIGCYLSGGSGITSITIRDKERLIANQNQLKDDLAMIFTGKTRP